MKISAIITGATGMVGEGVLHECLGHREVQQVLAVSRRNCKISDPKLQEILVPNFFDLSAIQSQLVGYNACFFCLGVSSIGKNERESYKLTYELTMNFARTVVDRNPGMVFCYISGAGTNEQSRMMWARVKGKTERDLAKLGFQNAHNFRPGIIRP
ncbi:MAG TPA: epimerase, partial [Chitinophagaceae bacterium]|nr:epimerase [Chitinophagaceae bacterium]